VRLHKLKPAEGSKPKKKRRGRGVGSGDGKTAGRGHKGQNARSGSKFHPTFEGGQTRLFRRLPKRGFNNIFKKEYAIINVKDLNRFPEDSEIGPQDLIDEGMIKKIKDGVKVLGDGSLDIKITVKAHSFSKSAAEKIEAAGGRIEVI